MLKVFLVEDEIVVREGLRKNIKWNDLGLACVGEAADGELAYPMIQETQPDILITDIKMPFMDGLQLGRLVKKEMPWIKIIIISGHDDFEYAQKAIGVGVDEYLLKPINSAQITEVVLKIKDAIEKEREQKAYLEQFKNDMLEFERLERKLFFKELVSKRVTVSELLDKGSRLDLQLSATGYNIILFQVSQDEDNADEYIEDLISLEQKIAESFSNEPRAILFERDLEGFAILVKGSAKEPAEMVTEHCLNILRGLMEQNGGISFFVAAGNPVQRLNELSAVFADAREAFVHRYISGPNEIVRVSDMKKFPPADAEELSLENLDPAKINKKILERFLRSAAVDEAASFIADYFERLAGGELNSMLFRQYIAMDTLVAVISFVGELGYDRHGFSGRFSNKIRLSEAFATVESAKSYLAEIITEALRLRESSVSQKYITLLQKAKIFIDENYGREDISLNVVAASVNISPSHFSTIFSQEMGVTFVEYLTEIRMEKAQSLLRCSSMKTSEIGYAVGYRDPHYFSYLFKKKLGLTPTDYRASGQGGTTNAKPQINASDVS